MTKRKKNTKKRVLSYPEGVSPEREIVCKNCFEDIDLNKCSVDAFFRKRCRVCEHVVPNAVHFYPLCSNCGTNRFVKRGTSKGWCCCNCLVSFEWEF